MSDTVEKNYFETLLTKLLDQETSKEMQDLKVEMLRRIVSESDIKPSRIPAPLNITEIGGYFNLMNKFKKDAKQENLEEQKNVISTMLNQTLASILGLPVQPSIQNADRVTN